MRFLLSNIRYWLEEFKFDSPSRIALDGADNLYVSDTNNHKIHRFDANGKNVTGQLGSVTPKNLIITHCISELKWYT